MTPSLAIVGMACIYPDARTPLELWENVLAQRRAFRRIPTGRLRAEDYYAVELNASDKTYAIQAAVIEGWEFDRVAFRVVGSTFRAADLTHWLALDVAAKALADAGFAEGRGLPRETTGVLLGNSLAGEFSRANLMRLRWPYVRRVVEAALAQEGRGAGDRRDFLERLEARYKSPFPAVGEESLAGGLSNTIAGRICNHFDLKGGGYTVDGACASSLLAVANACTALTNGDLDVALAGGVDLSLDPFELVGFAKTGALAADEMRVFDRRSAGFWPGEGCGFVTLMREEDALAQGCRIYATVRGWGISSDGHGGITRPEADGQIEALRRAYRRAGFGVDTVAYCEGHGTGTAVGDATELEVLARVRREANADAPPAVIGSIKANIGHAKAAAGIAGLIKVTMAVHTQVLPPTTGCEQPHALLAGASPALRVLGEAEPWPQGRPLRASVSGMGFGGINAHVVIEGGSAPRRAALSPREHSLSRSQQDAELFLFAAASAEELARLVGKVRSFAARLSRAELADLAAKLQSELEKVTTPGVRAGVVASKPAELAERLTTLRGWLTSREPERRSPIRREPADPPQHAGSETGAPLRMAEGVFLGTGEAGPRIAFLFPGQGSPTHLDGGLWRRRFESVHRWYERAALPTNTDAVSTRVMQPAVVTASLAGLAVLREFGLRANAALGHSLGEITALHWAGALEDEALLRVVRGRGAAMADLGSPTGAMLALAAPWEKVQPMLKAEPLTIVGYNSPRQTVVAGEADAVRRLARRAQALDCQATLLPVSHAFHTPLVGAALPLFAEQLAREDFLPLQHPVFSTVTGAALPADADLRDLLCRQVTSPVLFQSALTNLLELDAEGSVDLLIEVGPGATLAGLARDAAEVPAIALDAGGPSLRGLLTALGAAFAAGATIRHAALFEGRFTRAFDLDWQPKFFVNPCELAPMVEEASCMAGKPRSRPEARAAVEAASDKSDRSDLRTNGEPPHVPIELVRKLVAERAELPLASVRDDHRLLNDLHLNSITVGQLVSEAARQLELPRVIGLTEFANATVEQVARALEELKQSGATTQTLDAKRPPPGVDTWVESFAVEWSEAARPRRQSKPAQPAGGSWRVFAPAGHPLADTLRERLNRRGGSGVALCLSPNSDTRQIALLLEAARAVLALKREPRFVLVQHGWGGGGFARTLHLETPGLTTCVVNVPVNCERAGEWIVEEALAATGYTEVRFDEHGKRFEPKLTWLSESSSFSFSASSSKSDGNKSRTRDEEDFPIGPEDVLLVTGGGKGIAAECALALGRVTGAKLILVCRSSPETDDELARNLERFTAAGIRHHHAQADVADTAAVRLAMAAAQTTFGPVTAVMHAAGTNTPQLIGALDEVAFRRTVAPKLSGARNVLAAVDPTRLKLFVTFGSIIARAGLRGEADYATANEWLTAFTEEFGRRHPQCRCRALEWSVWAGAGMGERLGRIEALMQQGILPIPLDEGVRQLLAAVKQPDGPVARVVTSRFGEPATLKLSAPELPLQRFLERRRVFYPGVELIVDAELSPTTDPYLNDHVVQKQKLLPAVLGLEAMAQAAMALAGSGSVPEFEDVQLARPIVVADGRTTTIRLAALRRGPDVVEVCVRSEETDFQVDHFRALCRFVEWPRDASAPVQRQPQSDSLLVLDPATELYGQILFHSGRFRRLQGYHFLTAKECVAELSAAPDAAWFGPYLPGELAAGDPGAQDATLHAIQACIPHRRILPTGIDRLVIHRDEPGPRTVHARERARDGDNFIFDVEVANARGELIETWSGLRLRAVERLANPANWPGALLGPYVARRVEELIPGSDVNVAVRSDGARSRERTDELFAVALGEAVRIERRSDGRPLAADGRSVSAAHAGDFTLAVAGGRRVACDVETVAARDAATWRGLLGEDRMKLAELLAREHREDGDTAATRLWTVAECLRKAGLPAAAPLVLETVTKDGWVRLRSGALMIASGVATAGGQPLALAVAMQTRTETQSVTTQPGLAVV